MSTAKAKRPVRGGMKINAYNVLVQALNDGITYGWNRAHKHTNAPGPEAVREHIYQAVLNSICEYFDFDTQ